MKIFFIYLTIFIFFLLFIIYQFEFTLSTKIATLHIFYYLSCGAFPLDLYGIIYSIDGFSKIFKPQFAQIRFSVGML